MGDDSDLDIAIHGLKDGFLNFEDSIEILIQQKSSWKESICNRDKKAHNEVSKKPHGPDVKITDLRRDQFWVIDVQGEDLDLEEEVSQVNADQASCVNNLDHGCEFLVHIDTDICSDGHADLADIEGWCRCLGCLDNDSARLIGSKALNNARKVQLKERGVQDMRSNNRSKKVVVEENIEQACVLECEQDWIDGVATCVECNQILRSEVEVHVIYGCCIWHFVASGGIEESCVQVQSDSFTCHNRVSRHLEIESKSVGERQNSVWGNKEALDSSAQLLGNIQVNTWCNWVDDRLFEQADEQITDVCEESTSKSDNNLRCIKADLELGDINLWNAASINDLSMKRNSDSHWDASILKVSLKPAFSREEKKGLLKVSVNLSEYVLCSENYSILSGIERELNWVIARHGKTEPESFNIATLVIDAGQLQVVDVSDNLRHGIVLYVLHKC